MLTGRLKNLYRSNFANVFKGNFISKSILVIGGLLLVKYYGPVEFGVYSIFLSVCGIVSVLINLGLDHLIILKNRKNEITNSLNSLNLLATVICLIFIIANAYIPIVYDKSIVFLGIISGYLMMVTNNSKLFLSKQKKYKLISIITVSDAIFSFLFQVLFIFINLKNGLVIGSFIGFGTAFFLAVYSMKNELSLPDFKVFKKSIKSRMELLKFSFPSNLINTLGNNIMPILIVTSFPKELLGEYSFAVKILSVPLLLFSNSVSTVYYPNAVQVFSEKGYKELLKYTKKISRFNFLVIFSLYFLINTFGILFIHFYLSKSWDNVTGFIFFLSFGFLARSLINPIADVLTILKKNHVALIFNIFLLCSNLIAFFAGKYWGFSMLVYSFSILLIIGYGLLYLYIIYFLGNNERY